MLEGHTGKFLLPPHEHTLASGAPPKMFGVLPILRNPSESEVVIKTNPTIVETHEC
jgi:hypothetical protein